MSVAMLREHVIGLAGKPTTPALLCITGASGAGKTAAVRALRERIEARVLPTLAFDSLGVPSDDEMHAAWESPRGWQKAMTYHWVYTAKHIYRTHPLVVIEGSFDPQYAIAACSAHRVQRFAVVLLHTDAAVRRERLAKRGQAELDNTEMTSWASYLHEQTQQLGGVVVDAAPALEHVLDAVCAHAIPLLEPRDDEAPRDPRERMRAKRVTRDN
ncbi:MAG TPA: AAA family ATPase [Kofleriaceae bacterium]